MIHLFAFIGLGIVAGAVSGLVGIGGGIIIVPVLVLFFGFSQQMAQGTTLALMVPPLGAFAAWTYYRQGDVDLRAAGLICVGFFLGGFLGAQGAAALPGPALRKIFGGALFLMSLRMIFGK